MEQYLSEKEYELYDGWCGKPVSWYRVVRNMPSEIFNENRHRMEYVNGVWVYIVRSVTREECIEKYGEITSEEYGPRGGWKKVTFGSTTFISEKLRP
jgi:hypothetical protein